MANPLLLFFTRAGDARRSRARRRVPVPHAVPSTDAIFLMMRRMRTPLITLVLIFAVSVVGLTLIPGHDADGNPTHLTVFEAFYFISYTATTIGFGEITQFTTPQRMWVTFSIYLTVIGWAYAIGTSLSLMQDTAVREAMATQRFRRRVRRIREAFVLLAGYGEAGRQVVHELDDHGLRVVVVDDNRDRIDRLASDGLFADAPGLDADASMPGVLGLAGLGSGHCSAVLALTNSDDANLAVIMAATLLRPEVPTIARCDDAIIEERMRDFGATAVINPDDRYGDYLVLALQKPSTYRLITWLMAEDGSPLQELPHGLGAGRWVVVGDGQFVDEVARDLRGAGMTVDVADPRTGHPDVAGAAGLIAGTDVDPLNLAIAEHARQANPDLFVSVRQGSSAHRSLVEALAIDSVYTPTDLVANEALARVVTPVFWGFVEHAVAEDDAWAQRILERTVERCGKGSPERRALTIDRRSAPAVVRWLSHSPLTLADLQRHPDDRESALGIVPLLVRRGEETTYDPGDDTELRVGDRILLAGDRQSLDELVQTLDYDSVIEYVVTGRRVPDGWLWRRLTGSRGVGEARGARPPAGRGSDRAEQRRAERAARRNAGHDIGE